MPFPKIVCVVPTVRPQQYAEFRAAWKRLFDYYEVTTVTIWDGDTPRLEVNGEDLGPVLDHVNPLHHDLLHFKSDCCRNAGFLWAAENVKATVVVTADDDVRPLPGTDPIADHLNVLGTRKPVSWMNTAAVSAKNTDISEPFFRGVPYSVRNEAPVKVSHGCWVNVPDLDGPSQLLLTGNVNPTPNFYKGAIPKGVYYPHCGMWVACEIDALPLLYYAGQGPTTPFNRFADIWNGIRMKARLDELGWAVVSGYSIVQHSRASEVFTNVKQEADGLRENELFWQGRSTHPYFREFESKAARFETAIKGLLQLP